MRLTPSATFVLIAALPAAAMGQALFSFGNPSADEQAYIEMINRARANPGAEGELLADSTHPGVTGAISYYDVDLILFQSEMNALPAKPPLAPHAALTTAARGHSQWMFNNAQQVHDQPDGQTFVQRLIAAGYSYSTAGENIYSYADDAEHGHAGFEIDWGPGPGGMQDPRGHRDNIHSGSYREIGVGVVNGTNTVNGNTVGPQIVTQDFGNRSNAPYYGTGVAYYDLNGNNSYDVGEGISGLTVNVSGAGYYCITADGGGWAVPLPNGTAGTRTVTFSGLGVNQTVNLIVPSNGNAKADLKLNYAPPTFLSPPLANIGDDHTLEFTSVPGATAYNYTSTPLSASAAENCENLANATATTSAGYSVVQSTVKHEGTNAWRMTPSNAFPAADQSVELNPIFLGSPTASISFQSRLGYATTKNYARVQAKAEGTDTWVDIYSQQGTGSAGEPSFNLRTASLAAMNGKTFRIRFLFDLVFNPSTSRYTQTDPGFGWYIDSITFANVSQLGTATTGWTTTTNPTLPAPAAASWHVQVEPVIGGASFPGTSQTLELLDTNTFTDWASYHETQGGLSPGSLTADSDPDGDGRGTALEFAFGSNPVLADPAPPGFPSIQPSGTHFILRYILDTARTGVTITPEAGTDLGAWYTPGQPGAPTGFTDSATSTAGTLQTREAAIPRDSGPAVFMRLRATVP
jgi:hypothetical protein